MRAPIGMTAEQVMTRPVLTIRDDRTVHELSELLSENAISGVPVVDARHKVVGVVSVTDIAEQAPEDAGSGERGSEAFYAADWREKLNPEELRDLHVEDEGLLVRDIMMPTVYTVPDTTPVPEIARTMVSGRIHRLFVTHDGKIAGIVTALDLLKLLAEATPKPPLGRKPPARGARVSPSRRRRA